MVNGIYLFGFLMLSVRLPVVGEWESSQNQEKRELGFCYPGKRWDGRMESHKKHGQDGVYLGHVAISRRYP